MPHPRHCQFEPRILAASFPGVFGQVSTLPEWRNRFQPEVLETPHGACNRIVVVADPGADLKATKPSGFATVSFRINWLVSRFPTSNRQWRHIMREDIGSAPLRMIRLISILPVSKPRLTVKPSVVLKTSHDGSVLDGRSGP
jgi:hypothetical protein